MQYHANVMEMYVCSKSFLEKSQSGKILSELNKHKHAMNRKYNVRTI